MMARYYVILDSPDKRREFAIDNEDGKRHFLLYLSEQESGELFVDGFDGLKILYDTRTGDVVPVSAQNNNLNESFDGKTFQFLTQPITEMICLSAQIYFLEQLDHLNDKDLCKLIRQNHFEPDQLNATKNLTLAAVHKTFVKMLFQFQSPWSGLFTKNEKTDVQKVLSEALNHVNIDGINSRDIVDDILKDIRNKLPTPIVSSTPTP